ncbi:MAG: multiheme c-type cytochrome [Planctomycetota bacterium]|jgi:hypothetical protein|nr:multiheme c-type cytochrome [Planctomycetota bacterium]
MSRKLVALLLLALLTGALWLAPKPQGESVTTPLSSSGTTSSQAIQPAGDPASCLPCHEAVVEEWRTSMHAQAFTDPQVRAPDQSDNFRRTECIPCHAPRPVFEYGIETGTRVVARMQRRHDGVDCLSCHGLSGGGVAAERPGLTGACRPIFQEALSTPALCAPCHNQHDTHEEWKASPAFQAGNTCTECHMPRVLRVGQEAGAPRSGRSHAWPGGRDREFALSGLSLEHEIVGDTLAVTLKNTFAGHNLPSDSRNRALDLVVTLYNARGAQLPAAEGVGVRHAGGENGAARLRFRNPYRSSGEANTQLPAGKTATLEVPLPAEAARARIHLFYKLKPWAPDEEAHWSYDEDILLH